MRMEQLPPRSLCPNSRNFNPFVFLNSRHQRGLKHFKLRYTATDKSQLDSHFDCFDLESCHELSDGCV